jgi:hypothetical protein
VIHGYANRKQNRQNAVVMAHEILHTFGASDKYDAANQPLYPSGYAEPERVPLHPQRFAEIMAGRIPVSSEEAIMPPGLNMTRIGKDTAHEINWLPQ